MEPIDYYSTEYISRYRPKTRLEQREAIALAFIKSVALVGDATFVDVGCGDGYFLNCVSEVLPRTCSIRGLDYSRDQIQEARTRHSFDFATCNLEEGIPAGDGSVDLLYAGEVIEHLFDPDFFLSEVFRVLKIGGHVVLSTPNLNAWINRLMFVAGYQPLFVECSTKSSLYGYGFAKRFKKQDWPVGHVRIFNRRSLFDILKANGLSLVGCRGAVFEFIPGPLRPVDRLFAALPSLASDLVVLAQKPISAGSP